MSCYCSFYHTEILPPQRRIFVIAGNNWTVPLYPNIGGWRLVLKWTTVLREFMSLENNDLIRCKPVHFSKTIFYWPQHFALQLSSTFGWNDPKWRVRDATPSSNMADKENTNMEVDKEKNKPFANKVESLADELTSRIGNQNNVEDKKNPGESRATTEYCEKLQAWMWQYYTGYVNWQSWLAAAALPCPYSLQSASGTSTASLDINSQNWFNGPFGLTLSSYPPAVTSQSSRAGEAAGGAAVSAQPQQLPQENGNAQRPGKCCWRRLMFWLSKMKDYRQSNDSF